MWIKVTDRLPSELCDQFIVCNTVPGATKPQVVLCAVFYKGKFYQIEQWQSDRDADAGEVEEIKHVTHWMPLPSPPNSENVERNDSGGVASKCGTANKQRDAIICINSKCGWNTKEGGCGLVRCCPGRNK